MADDEQFVTIPMLGRDMQFRVLSPGQMLLVQRMGQRARKAADVAGDDADVGKAYTQMMVKILDVVDTLFVSEQDRDDVEAAVLNRQLDVQDLTAILFGGRQVEQPPDDADPVAMPKTLKGKKAAGVAKVAGRAASRRAAR